jgi:hypothetical protein
VTRQGSTKTTRHRSRGTDTDGKEALAAAGAELDTLQSGSPDSKSLETARRKLAAVQSLLAGKSLKQTARDAGVPYSTLHYWVHRDPHFKETFYEASKTAYERSLRLMQGASIEAATIVIGAMKRKVSTARLNAAQSVLKGAHAATELLDILADIEKGNEALERGKR